MRAIVRVRVRNKGETPWAAQGAKLVGPKGEAWRGSVWPAEPIAPGEFADLFIEARVEDVRTEGPFVLKLWEANGSRTVRLGRVAFPVLGAGSAFGMEMRGATETHCCPSGQVRPSHVG